MEIIRKRLESYAVATGIRYDSGTDVVQTYNGTTWVDTPGSDPRRLNQFDPPTTSDPRCDSAARMTAAMNEIFDALSNALSGGALAGDLGGIIMAWLVLFAGFAVLVALAVTIGLALLSIGSVDVANAYSAMDWDEFQCELLCLLGADGFITEAGLVEFQSAYVSTLTATQQNIINLILSIAGFGALNGFAATRGETGDCSECASCGWTHTFYADSPELNWWFMTRNTNFCNNTFAWGNQYLGATESDGAGHLRWIPTSRSGNSPCIRLAGSLQLPPGSTLTSIVWNSQQIAGSNLDNFIKWRKVNQFENCWQQFYSGYNVWTGSITGQLVEWLIDWLNISTSNGWAVRINSITFTGTGVDPFL